MKDKKGGWDSRDLAVTSWQGLSHPGIGWTANEASKDVKAGRFTDIPKTRQKDRKDDDRPEGDYKKGGRLTTKKMDS